MAPTRDQPPSRPTPAPQPPGAETTLRPAGADLPSARARRDGADGRLRGNRPAVLNPVASAFALSEACRAAGTVTPRADARERRSLFAWIPATLLAATAAYGAGGVAAGLAAAAVGLAVWWRFRIRKSRRRRLLWNAPFPPEHEAFLLRNVPHYRGLDEGGRELFRQRAKLFLNEVVFHGAGVEVTDGLRLYAAAAAVVPTLGFAEWEWPGLKELIFRPEGYEHGAYESESGVVTEFEESGMIGVAGGMTGTMMLSSEDLEWEFAHPEEGGNVGFHEFAHLMALQGLALARRDRAVWLRLLKMESERVRRGDSLLDSYAILNEDEFFAVASELFFTVPLRFRAWHRKLYAVLARCYRQDPAVWLDVGEPPPDRPPRRRGRRRGKTKSTA